MSGLTRLATVVLVGVGLSASSLAHAETITLTSSKDNTLIEMVPGDPPRSNGIGDSVYAGRVSFFGDGTLRRAVLAFDIAGAVPANAEITSVTLDLFLISSASGNENLSLYPLSLDWGEGTSNWPGGLGGPATPGDATWRHTYFDTETWGHGGGDYDPLSSASQVVGADTGMFYTWGPTARMLADVQGWFSNPASNFGWILIGNEFEMGTAKRLASKDHSVPDLYPVLTIEFVSTPECPADLDGDGYVGAADLAMLLASWGACPGCPADLSGDDEVGPLDLATLLALWGACL